VASAFFEEPAEILGGECRRVRHLLQRQVLAVVLADKVEHGGNLICAHILAAGGQGELGPVQLLFLNKPEQNHKQARGNKVVAFCLDLYGVEEADCRLAKLGMLCWDAVVKCYSAVLYFTEEGVGAVAVQP